jgi:hypothetical protein
MEVVSGTAAAGGAVPVRLGVGVAVGVDVGVAVGRGVVRVGMGLGRVGVGVAVVVGVEVGVRREPVAVAVGVGFAVGVDVAGVGAPSRAGERVPFGVRGALVAGALVVGAPEAGDGESFDRRSAGMAIPAPKTKNTAAMTNLDHCIASLSSPTRQRVNGAPAKPRSFFTWGRIVPTTPETGPSNRPTLWGEYPGPLETRMMEPWKTTSV